jgi:hypothetical protein
MTTLKIKVKDNVLQKVLFFLKQFSKDDIEVLDLDNKKFDAEKTYVQEQYSRYKSGKGRSYSIEEVEQILEDSISRHES